MKKLIAILLVFSVLFAYGCDQKTENRSECDATFATVQEIETTPNNEPPFICEEPESEEPTTRPQFVFFEDSKIIFDNGTYCFELPKTNFEEEISEELLLEFANMLSMSFGVEDYYDWNTTGQNVIKDVHHCTLSISDFTCDKEVFADPFDDEAYDKFMEDVGLEELTCGGVFTFSLKKYNAYLKDIFGPDVKQLSTEDFETGKSAIEKGLKVTGFMSESNYESFYTGKDDIILVQTPATGFGCTGEYIYDVKKDGNDYYVYTVGSFETGGLITDFEDFQREAAESVRYNIYNGYLQTKKYKFACTDDGDVYLKWVNEKYLIAENAEYDYVVKSPVEIKTKKAFTEEYKTVDVLPKGTKVISIYMNKRNNTCEVIANGYFGVVDSTCFEDTN